MRCLHISDSCLGKSALQTKPALHALCCVVQPEYKEQHGGKEACLGDGVHAEGAAGHVGPVQHDIDAVRAYLRPGYADLVCGPSLRQNRRHVAGAP